MLPIDFGIAAKVCVCNLTVITVSGASIPASIPASLLTEP
jgi:hypothetical protein